MEFAHHMLMTMFLQACISISTLTKICTYMCSFNHTNTSYPPSMKFALHHCVAHVIFKNKEASGVISISHLHLALGKKAQLASLTRFDSI